jgi:hypothetical protein
MKISRPNVGLGLWICQLFFSNALCAQIQPPVFSSSPTAPVECPLTVTVSDPTSNAVLEITSDGSSPSSSTGVPTPAPTILQVNSTTTLRAIALLPNGSNNPSSYLSSAEVDATYNCQVWGFADLHTHPATHLGFGADANGNNGLIWGKPADDGNLNTLTTSLSLPPCNPSTHNPQASGVVQTMSDSQIVSQAQSGNEKLPYTDNGQGDNAFSSWPASKSILHQQMDINSLQRAFAGGLRLLFASTTDDELTFDLWNQNFNALGQSPPVPNANFDFDHAQTQLKYIHELVAANPWMQIVTTPTEARKAINTGHLAVVLSLEMDNLSLTQIQYLVQNQDVRHVIPIHLVNNPDFGGTAVYNDLFNSENSWFHGTFFKTDTDSNVNEAPNPPEVLVAVSANSLSGFGGTSGLVDAGGGVLIALGAIGPFGWLADAVIAITGAVVVTANNLPNGAFGYLPGAASNPPPYGNKDINDLGLNTTNFRTLMQMQCGTSPCDLLLDVVHMGKKSADAALSLAETYNYPVMDSHTGIRCDGMEAPTPTAPATNVSCVPGGQLPSLSWPKTSSTANSINERSLPLSQVLRIKKLGGVVGFGMESASEGSGIFDLDPVATWMGKYAAALSYMGGRRVAIGSDTNGLSPLIENDPFGASQYDPVTVEVTFGPPSPASQPQQFQDLLNNQFSLGQKKFLLQQDGIATYGLMPDFFQGAWRAVQAGRVPGVPATASGKVDVIQALYNSAEDTIEMWEKVVAAEPLIPPPNTNQIATKCTISGSGPWVSGRNAYEIGKPIIFYTAIYDQNSQPLTFPVQVSYTGNIPGLPSPHSAVGLDQISVTPQAATTYTVTATVTSVSTLRCSPSPLNVPIPPVLSAVSSPITHDPNGVWNILANSDGSTLLTLTGQGFLNVSSVSIGGTLIGVHPIIDTSVQVLAPKYSGPLYQNVSVFVGTAGGLQSDSASIQYFTPGVPFVDAYSGRSCDGTASFTVEAFVDDSNGALVFNAPILFNIGSFSTTVKTDPTFGEADVTALMSSLTPAGQSRYSGSATYQGKRAPFAIAQPPVVNIASCRGLDNALSSGIDNGSIFNGNICVACQIADLPDYFNDSKYFVDDLIRLGALIPLQNRIYPNSPVSQSEFLYSLRKVLSPALGARLRSADGVSERTRIPMTRGKAVDLVSSLLLGQNAPTDTPSRLHTLTAAGYLRADSLKLSVDQPLTRAEMIELLWHVARLEVSSLGKMKLKTLTR